MKKIVAIIFIFVFSSSVAFAARPVPTQTGSQKFVPKNVPITPAMVNAGIAYTDAQSIRAEVEKLNKKVQKLEAADKSLWEKIFGKKKGALVALEGRLQSAIKTATDNSTAAQARAEEAFKKAEVADKKATDVGTKLDGIADICKNGMTAMRGEVETLRKIGQYALVAFTLGMILLFILALRKPKP
ncbi:MAG: hypothetical protein WA055_00575 [Candidatus Moraniibacteriota bacterium]